MNTQQRAAMQMALEALEVSTDWDVGARGKQLQSMKAITALREALAQHPMDYDQGFVDGVEEGLAMVQPQESEVEHYRAIKKRNAEVVALETAQPQEHKNQFAPDYDGTLDMVELIQEQAAKLEEWEKIKDPVVLHKNLLRGFPAQLTPDMLKHLLGENQPQGEWVDLTEDEIQDVARELGYSFIQRIAIKAHQALITKFKEKNTPPSVEAMHIETLEKTAQKIDWYIGMNQEWIELTPQELAAAIRGLK